MNIAQELSVIRDNIAEYGMTNITQLEYDAIYQQGRADGIDEELQSFAQWLWDNHYLVDEAFTTRLVEQYKQAQLKEQKNDRRDSQPIQ